MKWMTVRHWLVGFTAITVLCYSGMGFAALDRKLKVSSNDSTAGFLNGKIVAGTNVTLNETDDGANETLVINATGGGGGSAQVLDLADDAVNESIDLAEIATTGDTNSVFTEPTDDKLLIDLTKDWPKSDDADDVTCVGCIADSELATDFISETELDTEAELQTQLTDVSDVFTNNDGALNDDDLTDDPASSLSDVTYTSIAATQLLIRNGGNTAWENKTMSGDCTITAAGVITCSGTSQWTDAGVVLKPNTAGDGIRLENSGATQTADITYNGTTFSINLSAGNYRLDDLTNCDTIDTDADGDLICGTDASGAGGTPNILDLGDDGGNDSVDLVEIATTGDTNSIFTEPAVDKLLIAVGNNWPTADAATALSANGANCSAGSFPLGVDASGAVESCTAGVTDAEFPFLNTTPADGHILTYDGVTDNRYENVAMSGDITITAAGVTTIGATSVDAGNYAAASIDGDDINSNIAGRSLTLTAASPDTLDADSELFTHTKSFSLENPVAADDALVQLKFSTAITVTRVSCSTDIGTVTIQFDERAEATPNTVGTDVMTAVLVCDTNTQATTTFTNAGIVADVPLNLDIDAVASSPTKVRVHIDYTKDD